MSVQAINLGGEFTSSCSPLSCLVFKQANEFSHSMYRQTAVLLALTALYLSFDTDQRLTYSCVPRVTPWWGVFYVKLQLGLYLMICCSYKHCCFGWCYHILSSWYLDEHVVYTRKQLHLRKLVWGDGWWWSVKMDAKSWKMSRPSI